MYSLFFVVFGFMSIGYFTSCRAQQADSVTIEELRAKILVDTDFKAIQEFMAEMNKREALNDFNFRNTDWKSITAARPKTKKERRALYVKAGMTDVDEFMSLRAKQHKMFRDFFKKYPEIKNLPQDEVLAILNEVKPVHKYIDPATFPILEKKN